MFDSDPEHYKVLRHQELTNSRWFNGGCIAFTICILQGFHAGQTEGWPWLIGALAALFAALWARIDQQTTLLLIQIYLAGLKDRA